jgi:hypothetical protein
MRQNSIQMHQYGLRRTGCAHKVFFSRREETYRPLTQAEVDLGPVVKAA